MTSAMTDTVSTLNGSFTRIFDRNRQLFEQTLNVTQEESLSLINRRLERNAKILEHLKENNGLSDWFAVEQEWFMDTARDYFETGEKIRNRLFRLASGAAEEASEEGRTTARALRENAGKATNEVRRASEEAQRQTQRHAAQ